jgi:hypothetical protein
MSMIGKGGEDIFGSVRSTVKDFIRNTKEGETVVVYTFDKNVNLVTNVEIRGPLDKIEISQSIDRIDPKGLWTHTGDAVDKAFERSDILKEQEGNPDKPVAVVLFTDDKEDHEPNSHAIFLSQLPLKREMPLPHTFVIWLNKKKSPSPEISSFVDKLGDRGHLERIQDPAQIDTIRDKVVEFLPAALEINPSSLFFGSVEPGSVTDEQSLHIRTNKQTSVRVTLQGLNASEITLSKPESAVALKEGENEVKVGLKAAPDLPNGVRDGKLVWLIDEVRRDGGTAQTAPSKKDEPKYEVAVSLNIARVSLPSKILRLLAVMFAAFLISWVSFYLVAGKHPTEAWQDRYYLEGDLQILLPEDAGGDRHINLGEEKAAKIKLSSLQAGRLKDYLNGADAELRTVIKDGEKAVGIRSAGGNLYVQDRRVADANLSEGDIIDVGDLRMAYSLLNKQPGSLN